MTARTGPTRLSRFLLCFLHLVTACSLGGTEPPADGSEGDFAAPTSLRATLVFEPNEIEIGQVMVAELAVVTPAGYSLQPVAPVELPGLWLLGVRALPIEGGDGRFTHRTEFRIRPRELGTHTWPAMTLHVEGPEAGVEILEIPARTFEVVSIADRFANRDEPFGLEEQPTPAPTAGFGVGVLMGLALSGFVALVALAFRRRADGRRATQTESSARNQPPRSLREWAEGEIQNALDLLDSDPPRAATMGARLLRVYMSRRFGGNPLAATTEELHEAEPALALRALWPEFVRILHNFDDARFRPQPERNPRADTARVRRALEDSLRLVATSLPDKAREAD